MPRDSVGKGAGERNVLSFLFVPDPLVFLSVSKDLICRHAPLQPNNTKQEGGGVLLGTAEEAESKGGSQASMTL